jgi:hypothetical protein
MKPERAEAGHTPLHGARYINFCKIQMSRPSENNDDALSNMVKAAEVG